MALSDRRCEAESGIQTFLCWRYKRSKFDSVKTSWKSLAKNTELRKYRLQKIWLAGIYGTITEPKPSRIAWLLLPPAVFCVLLTLPAAVLSSPHISGSISEVSFCLTFTPNKPRDFPADRKSKTGSTSFHFLLMSKENVPFNQHT